MSPLATQKTSPRSFPLDVLRGIAILFVLFAHPVVRAADAGALSPLARCLETIGWTGVDLFFVLSGFLVGGLLFKELRRDSRLEVNRFLIRRGLKIWPSYFAFLAVVFVQEIRHHHYTPGYMLHALLPNLIHLQNYFGSIRPHTWSLAVEEHFYLFLPLLLLVLVRGKKGPLAALPAIPGLAVVLSIVCLGLRFAVNPGQPYDLSKYLGATQLRIDSLFWGVLIGYLYEFRPVWIVPLFEHRRFLLGCGVAMVAPMLVWDVATPFVHTVGCTLLYIGYGCILLAAVLTPEGSGIQAKLLNTPVGRWLALMGTFSYSIYLWHVDFALPVIGFRLHWIIPQGAPGGLRWAVALALYLMLATAVGVVMSKVIEQPALALRNRLFPSKTNLMETAPVVLPVPVLMAVTASRQEAAREKTGTARRSARLAAP